MFVPFKRLKQGNLVVAPFKRLKSGNRLILKHFENKVINRCKLINSGVNRSMA